MRGTWPLPFLRLCFQFTNTVEMHLVVSQHLQHQGRCSKSIFIPAVFPSGNDGFQAGGDRWSQWAAGWLVVMLPWDAGFQRQVMKVGRRWAAADGRWQLGKLRGEDPKLDRSKFRSKWAEL